MSDDMVKKSVDITEEDEEWLEDSYINFSKFVRRKIAERRAESIRDWKKEKLYNQIDGMATKGKELRKEWDEEVENLKEEYDAEIIEKNSTHWIFKHDGDEYSAHWVPDSPFQGVPDDTLEELSEEGKEFANKFVDSWFNKLNKFGEFVEEKTNFEIVGGDEATQDFEGKGSLSEFSLHSKYLPTEKESFRIKFESRVDLKVQDLEKSGI